MLTLTSENSTLKRYYIFDWMEKIILINNVFCKSAYMYSANIARDVLTGGLQEY